MKEKIKIILNTKHDTQIYLGFLFNIYTKQFTKMKGKRHIQSFNEHQENLNISDVMSSVIQKIETEISNAATEMEACRKYDAYKEGDIQEGKIEGLKFCLELIKHYS